VLVWLPAAGARTGQVANQVGQLGGVGGRDGRAGGRRAALTQRLIDVGRLPGRVALQLQRLRRQVAKLVEDLRRPGRPRSSARSQGAVRGAVAQWQSDSMGGSQTSHHGWDREVSGIVTAQRTGNWSAYQVACRKRWPAALR